MKTLLNNFDNIQITPAVVSKIEHREECIPYYGAFWSEDAGAWSLAGAVLPLFASPMACIIDDKNCYEFDKNGIIPIIPRTIPYEKRMELASKCFWITLGLDEFENLINTLDELPFDMQICIDIANGHMEKLIGLCKNAKHKFADHIKIMAGNIANSDTYKEYAKAGIDYIRCSIGSGNGCATNDLTGIGIDAYNLLCDLKWVSESVAREYNRLNTKYKSVPYIIYDGGCDSIRDIIIALALGANYVMCGKIFAQAEEACGEIIPKYMKTVTEKVCFGYPESEEIDKVEPYKYVMDVEEFKSVPGRIYYGMSTERAQREMGKTTIKHSEGKEYWIPIKYTLNDWVSRFVAAISSTMSYCNCKTLQDFIGKVNIRYGR